MLYELRFRDTFVEEVVRHFSFVHFAPWLKPALAKNAPPVDQVMQDMRTWQ